MNQIIEDKHARLSKNINCLVRSFSLAIVIEGITLDVEVDEAMWTVKLQMGFTQNGIFFFLYLHHYI